MPLQEIKNRNKSWTAAFRNALEGCLYAFSTQRNFLVHFILSFLVIILAFWLKISFTRFLVLIFAIVFGLVIEMANTAFEKTIDLITEEWHSKAKIVKDVSAGMMFLASLGLVAIGFLILFPPLWQKLFG